MKQFATLSETKFSAPTQWLRSSLLLLVGIVFSVALFAQATVTTDKPDYAPRSNAVFTGAGFQPYEQVQLKVKNLFRACNTVTADSSYLPWTVTADASGGFVTNWTVCDCAGDSLRLKATGLTSGLIAYALFSDAGTALTSPTWTQTTPTAGQTLTIQTTLTQQGNDNQCPSCVGNGNVIPTKQIVFSINNIQLGTATTNSFGVATLSATLPTTLSGPYNGSSGLRVDFAGDATPYAASTKSSNISIAPISCTAPSFTTCPGNQVANTAVNSCSASVNYTATANGTAPITYSYVFSGVTIGSGSGTGSGATFNKGVTNVTITAINGCSPNATCSFTVTVNDTEKPVITTNGNKTVSNDVGVCGAAVSVSASATDNCSVGSPTGVRSDALALNATYPVGVTTITWNVTDVNGNAAIAAVQTITVNDTEKPVITTNGNKTVSNDVGVCGAAVSVSASATDNCSVGSPTGVRSDALALNATYPVGVTTITWNVTDVNGNAAIAAVQTITVNDTEKPVITTNGNKTVSNDVGVCGAAVSVSASATDNCSVGSPTGVRSDALALNATYPVGVTTITWNVTDVNGNAAIAAVQTVTVNDTEKPVITTNGNKTVSNDVGVCGAAVSVSASATDNCSVGSPTGVRSDALALNATYPVGVTTITWNVTDINGNAAIAAVQTITVNDTEKPVITTNGNKTVSNDVGVCGAAVSVSASATDNCSVGSPTGVRSDALALNATYPVGVTTITWNVTDVNGNAAIAAVQTITVNDTEKPVITTNGNKTVSNDVGVCGAAVSVSASATDNCSVGSPTGVRSDALALNATYPVGVTTITWNVTDVNGNAAIAAVQTITVNDTEKPVITTNGNKTVSNDVGVCGAAVSVSASATDNCSVGSPTGVRSDALALNATYPVGVTTITWNVTDINGNAAIAAVQTVTVNDTEKPVITTNGNKTVSNDVGVCGAAVSVSASATDNCSVGSPTGVRSDALALNATYPVGVTTITWNVTDVNGNAAIAAVQTITVNDTEKPVITTNGNKTVSNDVGVCGAAVSVSASATDNCSVGSPTGVRSDALALNATYPVGVTTITWNVTDVNGNAAIAAVQTITVNDTEKPVITTNGNKTVSNDVGVCGAAVSVSASATDNCSVGSPTGVRSDALALNATYPVGVTTITWNVTDVNGNAAIAAVQTITVNDTEKPVITTNGNKTVSNDVGVCGAAVSVSASATDNCSVGSPTGVRSDALALNATYPVGVTTITWNVTDINGNAAIAAVQTVTVNDTEKPVITTNGNKTVSNDVGVCGAAVSVSASATDNCSVGSPTGVRSDALALNATYPVGVTTITWNVTDVNGNAAIAAVQTITVNDTEKPVITTNGNKTVSNDVGVCGAAVSVSASATDNCSVGSPTGVRSDALALNATYPVGVTTITWNVTDVNGNAAIAAVQTITVNDTEKPVITTNGNKTVSNDVGVCGAAVSVSASATDNCSVGSPTGVRSDALALNATYPVGVTTITWNVTDVNGNAAIAAVQTVTVNDTEKPVWSTTAGSLNRTVYCGDVSALAAAQALTPSATDNCSVASVVKNAGSLIAGPNGTYTNTFIATDGSGNTSAVFTQVITVLSVTIDASSSSNSIQYVTGGATASLTAYVSQPGVSVNFKVNDNSVCNVTSSTTGTIINSQTVYIATCSISNLTVGLYKIEAIAGSSCASSIAYISVYDPNAGFVTGGGWINSPAGAYKADETLTGKANFGFNAQYKKGSQSLVEGSTEFQFKAGDLNFKSTNYTAGTLVIAGFKAIFQGSGTINGMGTYNFMLSAIDGAITGGGGTDKIRMKITTTNGVLVYDNLINATADNADPTTELGGGSIVIHQAPGKKAAVVLANNAKAETLEVKTANNPSLTGQPFVLKFKSDDTKAPITLKVMDINGKAVELKPEIMPGATVEIGRSYVGGLYIAEATQNNKRVIIKLMKQ